MARPQPAADLPAVLSADYRRMVTAHREQLDALRTRAADAARAEVRAILRELERRFHAHHFRLIQGMGHISVAQSARAMPRRADLGQIVLFYPGDKLNRYGSADNNVGRIRSSVRRWRNERVAAIFAAVLFCRDEIGAEIGDVDSKIERSLTIA